MGMPSRCVTRVRFHGTRWEFSLAIVPPGPRWPPATYIIRYIDCHAPPKFYVCADVPHTHPAEAGRELVSMRWKLLNKDPRGERKKGKEGENTHQHTWPGAGEPWKGKGKEKRRPTETGQDQRRGGKDGSAWTNLTKRKPKPTWARAGPKPYLGKETTHGTHGD